MPKNRFVYVVDDDDATRASAQLILERAGFLCRTYASAEEVLVTELRSQDCALVDIRLPGMTGLELLERLNQVSIPVVIVTGFGDVPTAVRAMKLGAMDFLEKPYRDSDLINALRSAFLSPLSANRLIQSARAATERVSRLTKRERQILNLICSGSSSSRIGERLGISGRTVEHHRRRIMSKCEANGLAELVRLTANANLDVL